MTQRALQKVPQTSRSKRALILYGDAQATTMGSSITSSITTAAAPTPALVLAVVPIRKCPRPCHVDKRTYARRHRLHLHRVGPTSARHHNRRRTDYGTDRLAIA